jgi:hypothetical protein
MCGQVIFVKLGAHMPLNFSLLFATLPGAISPGELVLGYNFFRRTHTVLSGYKFSWVQFLLIPTTLGLS